MKLKRIGIRNFRRLKSVEIAFEANETVFVGPNNSGKTSATAAVRSFLGRRDFKIHDISASEIDKFNRLGQGEEVEDLPSIELDFWFSVDPDNISFGQVILLSTGVSVDFSEIGMRCSLELKSKTDLLEEYNTSFPIKENDMRSRSLSHFLGLEGVLKKHFQKIYFSLETIENEIIETPMDPADGKRTLRQFLRVDFVDAQRGIDDENASRSNKLSEAFASYYKDYLDQAETNEEAVGIIDENNGKLSDHYQKHFKPLFATIQGLGVPPVNDRQLKIVSSLSPQDALKGNTELFYSDPDSDHELPEAYNGLGFKNLVFMAVQIDHFHRQWLATEENRPLCQIIFVEEPEVHLHVQVQQTFIKNMWGLLSTASPEGTEPPQLAITTHSSHILDTVDFSKVRYFRRCESAPAADDGPHRLDATTIHSLRDFAPEEVGPNGADVDPAIVVAFLQKYLKLTHCDLFFADAAILVEGTVERLLLPKMIQDVAPKLDANYLTTLEVGGAYSQRFAGLLEFLRVPYLVITDIDATDPDDNGKACRADVAGAVSSNSSLKSYFTDPLISILGELTDTDKEQVNGNRFVAFQQPVSVLVGGQEMVLHGRTLEETFVYENLPYFQADDTRIKIDFSDTQENMFQAVYEHIGKRSFKKTEFALDLLSSDGEWVTPKYISDGLIWLQTKLNPPLQNQNPAP